MKLRIVLESWRPIQCRYAVEELRAISTTRNEWIFDSSHASQTDAEAYVRLRMVGPQIIKEYDSDCEFKDHERTFL